MTLAAAVIILTFTFTARAAAAPAGSIATRVDELITVSYFHGMPPDVRAKVRALGPEAIPILSARLHDPRYRAHRTMICSVIGISGEPEGFPILRSIVWDPGEVSNNVLGSPREGTTEFVAQSAMGFLAKRSNEALEYLQQSTNPAFWDSLPWYRLNSSTRTHLVSLSIHALSCSERPEARAFLLDLTNSARQESIRSRARDALTRFDEIEEIGYEELERRFWKRMGW